MFDFSIHVWLSLFQVCLLAASNLLHPVKNEYESRIAGRNSSLGWVCNFFFLATPIIVHTGPVILFAWADVLILTCGHSCC